MAIGQVPPVNVVQRTSQVRPVSNAFGAGVADALGGLAQAAQLNESAQSQLLDVQAQRDQRLAGFDAQRQFIEWQTQVDKQYEELRRGAPADGRGFTDTTHNLVAQSGEAFLAGLPDQIRPQFAPKVAAVQGDVSLSAYKFEYQRGNDAMIAGVDTALRSAVNRVAQSPAAYQNALDETLQLVDTADLEPAQKKVLRQQVVDRLKVASFQGEMLAARSGRGTVRGPTENDVVAAGVSGPMRGLLNGIAQPESGGSYGAMYGGGTITDFSRHPNRAVTITEGPHKGEKSTAAGRYQFTYPTWLEAKQALGLPDFSPESQDRAAIWLARKEYAARTGESLDEVLASGDRAKILGVNAALSGRWAGLTPGYANALANSVLGVRGTRGGPTGSPVLPNPFTDSRYADIPLETKLQLERQANSAANLRERQQTEALRQARLAEAEALNHAIVSGSAGETDINTLYRDGRIDTAQRTNSLALYRREQTIRADAEAGARNVASGLPVSNKQANALVAQTGILDGIRAGDTKAISEGVLPLLQNSGILAPAVVDALTTQMQNPARSVYALDALSALRAANRDVLAAQLSSAQMSELNYYDVMKRVTGGPAAAVEKMQEYRDIATTPKAEEYRAAGRKVMADTGPSDVAQRFANRVGLNTPKLPINGQQALKLFADYSTLYQEGMVKFFGNADNAEKYADEEIKQIWSVSDIGGTSRLMQQSPSRYTGLEVQSTYSLSDGTPVGVGTRVYPKIDGTLDWVDAQIRDERGWDTSVQFQLIPDQQTINEGKGGRIPSYNVVFMNSDGKMETVLNPDGTAWRYGGMVPDGLPAALAEQSNAQQGLSDLYTLGVTGAILPPGAGAEAEAYRAQIRQSTTDIAALSRPKEAEYSSALRAFRVDQERARTVVRKRYLADGHVDAQLIGYQATQEYDNAVLRELDQNIVEHLNRLAKELGK